MRGTKVKQLRREAFKTYVELQKKHGSKLMPFKSIFRQIKRFYNTKMPIYKDTPRRIAWPTSK